MLYLRGVQFHRNTVFNLNGIFIKAITKLKHALLHLYKFYSKHFDFIMEMRISEI
jgi:hypothetical protein